jgi:hypothetical protein
METSASFEARSAPLPYPTGKLAGSIKRRERRMKTKLRSKADPIERPIEFALRPGAFIRRR